MRQFAMPLCSCASPFSFTAVKNWLFALLSFSLFLFPRSSFGQPMPNQRDMFSSRDMKGSATQYQTLPRHEKERDIKSRTHVLLPSSDTQTIPKVSRSPCGLASPWMSRSVARVGSGTPRFLRNQGNERELMEMAYEVETRSARASLH